MQALANSTIRLDIPPVSISDPANIKRGIAIIGQESNAENTRCAHTTIGMLGSNITKINEPTPMANAIGIPMMKNVKIQIKRINTILVTF